MNHTIAHSLKVLTEDSETAQRFIDYLAIR